MGGREVDIRVFSREAHGDPLLALALKAALPKALTQLCGEIVGEPTLGFRQELRLVGADLLLKLAQRGLARALASIDATLRHLPGVAGKVDALGHENLAAGVQQHDTDAAPLAGRAGLDGQAPAHLLAVRSGCLSAIAQIGAKAIPLRSRLGIHCASRSIVTG